MDELRNEVCPLGSQTHVHILNVSVWALALMFPLCSMWNIFKYGGINTCFSVSN